MGIPVITTTVTLPRDPAVFQRDHNRALRTACAYAAEYHHRVHIPRHFQGFAAAKYGYAKRSPRYIKWKERVIKGADGKQDLVFSGMTRSEITKNRAISATPKGATLRMRIPISGGTGRLMDEAARARTGRKALTIRAITAQRNIIMRVAEVEAISRDEINTLMGEVKRIYFEIVNQPHIRRRKRYSTKN